MNLFSTFIPRLTSMLLASLVVSCASLPPARTATSNASQSLKTSLETAASRVDGQVSIAIVGIDSGLEANVAGDVPVPLYSTFKAWVGVAVADAVERGVVRWTDTVRIEPSDLVFEYQPIAEAVGEGRDFTLQELVRWSIGLSDNPSVDALVAHIGGQSAVHESLERLGLGDIVIRANEGLLHSQAEELRNEAASMSRESVRRRIHEGLSRANQSTALGVAHALASLARGEVLGEEGTGQIISELHAAETGRNRLRAGLPDTWSIAHKTGTAHTIMGLGGVADVGIITAMDGARYAVAVFTVGSSAPRQEQEQVVADVARALVNMIDPA